MRSFLPVVMFGWMALAAQAQYQFRTAVNLDGTLTVYNRGSCPTGALVIPDAIDGRKVTVIGGWAFSGRASLTSVTIPGSVTSIGIQTFSGCTGLTNVIVGTGVSSIGPSAFSSCTSLTSITIPDSVTSIGDHAFARCTGLTDVTIPESVTSIGYGAFLGCIGLTSVTIPGSVTSIGIQAFSGCTGLTNVIVGTGVSSIGPSAFSSCTGLTSITIPDSVTSIGDGAFEGCTGLTSIAVDPLNSSYVGLEGVLFDKSLTVLVLCPPGKAGSYTIPGRVNTIQSGAFSGCTGLTSIAVDALNSSYVGLEGVLFDKSLTVLILCPPGKAGSYTIPGRVKTIQSGAFSGCTGLTDVIIGTGVTSIGNSAFSFCTSLTSITIPDSVTSIGPFAFDVCTSLTSITIPNSVTSIGREAFSSCSRLTSITIPASVISIGEWAFSLTGLKGMYFQGNAPSAAYDITSGGREDFTVYHLTGTTGWGKRFAGQPTALWTNPLIPTGSVRADGEGFAFTISWAPKAALVVESCSDLAGQGWSPIRTNTPSSGSWIFSDPNWKHQPARFYRVRGE